MMAGPNGPFVSARASATTPLPAGARATSAVQPGAGRHGRVLGSSKTCTWYVPSTAACCGKTVYESPTRRRSIIKRSKYQHVHDLSREYRRNLT